MVNQNEYDSNYIYIPIWLDLLFEKREKIHNILNNLHSNMVRFIMCASSKLPKSTDKFTFQYG